MGLMNNGFSVQWVRVKFEDSNQSKRRPTIILSIKDGIAIIAPITKHTPRKNYQKEYAIKDWKEAGLKYPSTIRLSKVLSVPVSELTDKVGNLSARDTEAIKKLIESIQNNFEPNPLLESIMKTPIELLNDELEYIDAYIYLTDDGKIIDALSDKQVGKFFIRQQNNLTTFNLDNISSNNFNKIQTACKPFPNFVAVYLQQPTEEDKLILEEIE